MDDEVLQGILSQFEESISGIPLQEADAVHECFEVALLQDDLPVLHHGTEPQMHGIESSVNRVAKLIAHQKSLTMPLRWGGFSIMKDYYDYAMGLTRMAKHCRRTQACNKIALLLPLNAPCA